MLNGVQAVESFSCIIHDPYIASPQNLVLDDAEQTPSICVVVDQCGFTGSYKWSYGYISDHAY